MNYTYQLNPYETFENGKQANGLQDIIQSLLLQKSIRQEAARYLETKLTLGEFNVY